MHELSPGELQLENLLDAEATAGKKATVVSEPADSLRVIPTRRALRAATPPAPSGEFSSGLPGSPSLNRVKSPQRGKLLSDGRG
jgi:hypothetical protein